ncbi:hypothetical protein RND71_035293 [Anisodus tanguticus]|uniref:tryptophan synthase n=1 Tax=Anisodus tanguticus TaxID=243964 RepID=A0AAE1R6U6_9SOLA|nr:hypothetical protein RND71_035293 [Anisodus tanguticus]
MNCINIMAATGAEQHGIATAAACAKLSLECTIFMGSLDMERQPSNVLLMKHLGAKVKSVEGSFKDAMSEGIRHWVNNLDTSYFLAGAAIEPHLCPTMVSEFQSVIGKETRKQDKEKWVGNQMYEDVRLIGVQAGGTVLIQQIVEPAGLPLSIDFATDHRTRPSMAKVRLEVDLTKPKVNSISVEEKAKAEKNKGDDTTEPSDINNNDMDAENVQEEELKVDGKGKRKIQENNEGRSSNINKMQQIGEIDANEKRETNKDKHVTREKSKEMEKEEGNVEMTESVLKVRVSKIQRRKKREEDKDES